MNRNKLEIATDLINAYRELLALHYKYDDRVPDSHLERFHRIEMKVKHLSDEWDLENHDCHGKGYEVVDNILYCRECKKPLFEFFLDMSHKH